METIKSFLINHDAHPEGVYLSHEEHNIYTYDLRFKNRTRAISLRLPRRIPLSTFSQP